MAKCRKQRAEDVELAGEREIIAGFCRYHARGDEGAGERGRASSKLGALARCVIDVGLLSLPVDEAFQEAARTAA